jgi:hypothetical protein
MLPFLRNIFQSYGWSAETAGERKRRKRREKNARQKQRGKDREAGVLAPNSHDPDALGDSGAAFNVGNTFDKGDTENASDNETSSGMDDVFDTENVSDNENYLDSETAVDSGNVPNTGNNTITRYEKDAAIEKDTNALAEGVRRTRSQALTFTEGAGEMTAEAALQGDQVQRSTESRKIDVAATQVDAAKVAESNVEDGGACLKDAQHVNRSENSNEETRDQRASDKSEHQNVQVIGLQSRPSGTTSTGNPIAPYHQPPAHKLGLTTSVWHQIVCPVPPDELKTMNKSDLEDKMRADYFAALAHRTLADFMWRTVIFANYFSSKNPAKIGLPGHLSFSTRGQQRFEIVVQESKLLGTCRAPPTHRAVEDAVVLFLSRTWEFSTGDMAKFTNANRDIALLLHARLVRERMATTLELYDMFTRCYGRPYAPRAVHTADYVGVEHKGLELLFDSSNSFTYPGPQRS